MKNRKEWLQGEIGDLENKALFDELDEVDKIFLDGYKTELKIIELKERGEWREDKTTEGYVTCHIIENYLTG